MSAPMNSNSLHDGEAPDKLESGKHSDTQPMLASSQLSHSLALHDPLNPVNWPLHRKITTSAQGWMFGFTVAVGLTCFSAAKNPFVEEFGLSMMIPEKFIAGFSLYLFGIAFAPLWVPHVTERVGRSSSYAVYITLNAVFNLGAGFGKNVATVLVCRFFAGFFGGPCLVILEGTFADIWSAETTNTYYAFQGIASFWGAAFGPFFGGYLVQATNDWRWTHWFPAVLGGFALAIGLSMPETYQREIPRRQGKLRGKTRAEIVAAQSPAESGVTFGQILKITVVDPVVLFFTEPVVTISAITMFIDWALTFQWFISVPAALGPPPPMGPGFDIVRIGKAFLGAVCGSGLGAVSVIIIEAITNSIVRKKKQHDPLASFYAVEYRVIPAIIGTMFITAAIFWVANTVNPNFPPIVPITGTAFFVWGSSMITFSIVPYTFDLYHPAPTLSASESQTISSPVLMKLTTAKVTCQAVGRILAGAFLPLVILQDITSSLTPKWGLGLFGFFTLALIPLTVLLFTFGGRWRMNSKYNK